MPGSRTLAWCLRGHVNGLMFTEDAYLSAACLLSLVCRGASTCIHVGCMLAILCLQRGIDLPTLDVTYFTSLSYYMLLLFGLRGVMSLFFKEDTIDETQVGCCIQSRPLPLSALRDGFWWLLVLVNSRRRILGHCSSGAARDKL